MWSQTTAKHYSHIQKKQSNTGIQRELWFSPPVEVGPMFPGTSCTASSANSKTSGSPASWLFDCVQQPLTSSGSPPFNAGQNVHSQAFRARTSRHGRLAELQVLQTICGIWFQMYSITGRTTKTTGSVIPGAVNIRTSCFTFWWDATKALLHWFHHWLPPLFMTQGRLNSRSWWIKTPPRNLFIVIIISEEHVHVLLNISCHH